VKVFIAALALGFSVAGTVFSLDGCIEPLPNIVPELRNAGGADSPHKPEKPKPLPDIRGKIH
jgi:hypothetical protein